MSDDYQILPPAQRIRKEPRPAEIMPEWTSDSHVPPSAGGPWTDLHAGVMSALKDKLAKIEEHQE